MAYGKGKVSYESFYGGGVSSLSPEYGNFFTGYRMDANQLGYPGNPATANQLGETVERLKQGVKAFEVTMLQPQAAETIPKQHFKEMRALMKLSGVKPSVHGPMIDAAGFDEKGNWGNEIGREDNERRMFDTIQKAAMLDTNGNVPVVFHSSAGAPGAEFRPGKKEWGEEDKIMQRGAAINRETGQAVQIKREYKFRPEAPWLLEKGMYVKDGKVQEGGPAGVLFSAEGSIDSINRGEWEDKLTSVAQMNKHAEEIIGSAPMNLGEYMDSYISADGKEIVKLNKSGEIEEKMHYFDTAVDENGDKIVGQRASYDKIRKAGLFLENADLAFKGAFHTAYKYGDEKQKEKLKELAWKYKRDIDATEEVEEVNGKKYLGIWSPVERQKVLDRYVGELRMLTDKELGGKTPKVFQGSNEFAIERAAKTFGNLAMKSYSELGGNKAPVLAIEEFHPGTALADTEDMKKLVEESRDVFVKQLVKEKGISKAKADKIAESKIGVTWDVGHINMIKKYGFTDKDVIEQTKKIAPMVKHVHLTDNFGFADSDLPPGMGNVPIKQILEQLEKTGNLKKMRKIVEAGAFVQHFKKSPHPFTLAALGSPLYGMKNAPYWNQVENVQGNYFGGYGTLNPSIHHSYFGAGFTTMPVELGGQMPGGSSRFGGTPMA